MSQHLNATRFNDELIRFRALVAANDKGNAFSSFGEGVAAAWESYKPRLRAYARQLLSSDRWVKSDIGAGKILKAVIAAVEIQDGRKHLTNNLVFWQNRFGHANRGHRGLLEALGAPKRTAEIEDLLFDLYRGDENEGGLFERISALTYRVYPLMAYLYFLKDADRFMPIHPTGYDEAFRHLGVDLVTLRNCSWANYRTYNDVLMEVRDALRATGLANTRLIDAHSFCWLLVKLPAPELGGQSQGKSGKKDAGRILGGREKSIADMKYSIIETTKNSYGQIVEQIVQKKNKELRLSDHDLEALIRSRLTLQGDRCALTGIPFQFKEEGSDKSLWPSPDRIDSDGHYEEGNIQIVCRFVNFWKSNTPNDEFLRLLSLVRGVDLDDGSMQEIALGSGP